MPGCLIRSGTIRIILLLMVLIPFFETGCGPDLAESIVSDFIIDLPKAEREFRQVVLDLSDPTDHRFLSGGWYLPEPGEIPGTPFLWASGSTASVRFPVGEVEDMELYLSARPLTFEGVPGNRVDLTINQTVLGSIHLADDWRVYRMEVPSEALDSGDNALHLDHARSYVPADVWTNSTDHRILSASYAFFVLRSRREPLPPGQYTLPQVLGAKDFHFQGLQRHILHDEPPCRFTYRLTLPSRPVLRFGAGILPDSIRTRSGPARQTITICPEGSRQPEIIFQKKITPPRRSLEMGWTIYRRNLKDYAGRTVELTFECGSTSGGSGIGNEGSWLEPVLLNRHVRRNLILITGTGQNWPMTGVGSEGAIARLRSESRISGDFNPSLQITTVTSDPLPVPMPLLRSFSNEGFETGYFFAGRNQLMTEDLYSGFFSALAGIDTSDPEDIRFVSDEAFKWIQRLGGDGYVLILDLGKTMDTPSGMTEMEKLISKIFSWGLTGNSLIVSWNGNREQPIWIKYPQTHKIGTVTGWLDMEDMIRKLFELP
ncbi:hypothetical protein JXA40_00740 [bacterium]|nr:hypothetical protein [candidate division CSSED10-310 bacterium]